MKKANPATPSAAEKAEAVRVQRLREDAKRPISVNLEETIALSHKLMQFAGAARRAESESRRPDDDSATFPPAP